MALALAASGCALLVGYTHTKLETMAQLRGDAPGIAPRMLVLRAERRRFRGDSAEYFLDDPANPQGQPWTLQLTSSQRGGLRFGDTLRVRCLDADRSCYLRDSVYVNDGNMGFDRGLRWIELAGLGVCLVAMAQTLVRWRRALRLVTPPG